MLPRPSQIGGRLDGGVKTCDVTGLGLSFVPSYLISESVLIYLCSVFNIFYGIYYGLWSDNTLVKLSNYALSVLCTKLQREL